MNHGVSPITKNGLPAESARWRRFSLTLSGKLGVDACPMEGFVPAEFDQVLGLPDQGLAAVVCCALGYRHADDKYAVTPKTRFPKSDLLKAV